MEIYQATGVGCVTWYLGTISSYAMMIIAPAGIALFSFLIYSDVKTRDS